MTDTAFASSDDIRALFSAAMSAMYRVEVPQYGTLISLVAEVNAATLDGEPTLRASLAEAGALERLSDERHGAIRLGTPAELAMMARLFAVMGMEPVGYYDLSVAGLPVHSTAFRPITDAALAKNPFRVFTSLLRLDLIEDTSLRAEVAALLDHRRIFTPRAVTLIALCERDGGLSPDDAEEFIREALTTFRWHSETTVEATTYRRLSKAHRLIADIACFPGPHINHLTPRTLDIDTVQRLMPARGIEPKEVIEGPPERRCPILLRQTSFKALEESIVFRGETGAESGTHTARFGEIEQRGVALTPKGRALYDALLASVRNEPGSDYATALVARFAALPDDWDSLRRDGLAFFRARPSETGLAHAATGRLAGSFDAMVAAGEIAFDPIVYEDFLPVSAAGIFQSNLATDARVSATAQGNRAAFEAALGRAALDEMPLYAASEAAARTQTLAILQAARI